MTRLRIFRCNECDAGTDHFCTFVDSEGLICPRVCPDGGRPCDWHEVETREVSDE